jgi:predicted  nucleic acid-binding Zn-ribbon protein
MNPDALLVYIRNQSISDAARKQLQQISDLKTQIVATDSERSRLNSDVESTTRDEQRNRDNIASLSTVSGQQQLVQEYARKLADQEVSIAKARDRQKELDQQKTQLQSQLNNLIDKLEF